MRTTDRSMAAARMLDGYATIPDASYLQQEDATALAMRIDAGDATWTDVSIDPAAAAAASPARARSGKRASRSGLVTTVQLRVQGSRPARVQAAAWTEPGAPGAPPPPAAEQLARGSSQMRRHEGASVPRSSTAPPYPLVARSGPRTRPPLTPLPQAPLTPERPIAWGRVIAAIALMSALIGGAIGRFAYRAGGGPAGGAAGPASSSVAVLPFENRSSDPALREAPQALAQVLAGELAAQTMLELAAPRPEGDAPAAVVRGSVVDDPAGGVQLRVEIVRRGARPVPVLDRRAAPDELAAVLRAGVPAFAGLLVDPRDVPYHLELGRRAIAEGRLAIAARHLRTVLLYDPNHRGALHERAVLAQHVRARAAANPDDPDLAPAREVLAP